MARLVLGRAEERLGDGVVVAGSRPAGGQPHVVRPVGHRLGCVLAAAVRARDRAERGDRQVGRRAPWEGQDRRHARAQVDHCGHVGDCGGS